MSHEHQHPTTTENCNHPECRSKRDPKADRWKHGSPASDAAYELFDAVNGFLHGMVPSAKNLVLITISDAIDWGLDHPIDSTMNVYDRQQEIAAKRRGDPIDSTDSKGAVDVAWEHECWMAGNEAGQVSGWNAALDEVKLAWFRGTTFSMSELTDSLKRGNHE